MQKKNNNYKNTIVLGVILMAVGITLMSINYIRVKREEVFNDMNLLLSSSYLTNIENNSSDLEELEESGDDTEASVIINNNTESNYEPYIATIKIPKIDLERGFYDKKSSLNNVDYNILFHNNSDYPDVENGNVILAGHSGTSSVSYFKNLYLLEKGDLAYITYKSNIYTYKIISIYYEEKDGSIAIYRYKDKSTLTLITCTKDDNEKQTIYILERL